MTAKVTLLPLATYEPSAVDAAIDTMLTALQPSENWAGKRVVIKPNLLKADAPEDGVTTHPAVIGAVAAWCRERGASVLLAESPGGPYTKAALRSVYKACGVERAAVERGFALNEDVTSRTVDNPRGVRLKKIEIIEPILSADIVINIAKLKTHGMMQFTGAVKNVFGVIPGLKKADYHFRLQHVSHFAEQLVDIAAYVSPAINLIDGVTGMDGNGPSAGERTRPGILIGSDSPYAADLAALRCVGIDPSLVPTTVAARERGLPGSVEEDLVYTHETPAAFSIEPYRLPPTRSLSVTGGILPKWLEQPLRRALTPRPVLLRDRCVRCGVCARHCPATCIEMTPYPTFDYDRCIRCFCCHELCPHRAIDIRTNRLYEALMKR